MKTKTRVALIGIGVLLLVGILTTVVTYFANRPSDRVIAQWEQPASVNYNSPLPIRLMIIERGWDWGDLLYRERTYYIYLGYEYPYGRRYRFPFYYHELEVETKIGKSTVEWTTEGVTFKSTFGETLFIPRSAFAR
jgi:hypothetical protein